MASCLRKIPIEVPCGQPLLPQRPARLYLHVWHIVFSHPVTKSLLEFYAPLPPEFQKIVHAPSVS